MVIELEVLKDAEAVAARGAALIAEAARATVRVRNRFAMAVSGGTTPWAMLHALANEDMPWDRVHVFQVDERVAPAGHPDRNLTHLVECLSSGYLSHAAQVHPMAVEDDDLDRAAAAYEVSIRKIVADGVLDLVHLGLGADGHTASLVPGDPVLDVEDRDVAPTSLYQGRRRLTLTYPLINRALRRVWLVTGAEKARALGHLLTGDSGIPAGRIAQRASVVVADEAAGRPRP